MKAKTAKAEKMTPTEQRAAFEATARELGCDESPDAFEAAVKKVARHKAVAPSLDEPATTAENEKR